MPVDPVTRAIEKYKNHPSILKLNNEMTNSTFDFQFVSGLHMSKLLQDIASSKAFQKGDIPPIILKANEDTCSMVLTSDVNRCIVNEKFPNNLKNADITPTFKNDDRSFKSNYRPVSILPTLSKLYEKTLYMQIYEYFNTIFSKYLCGFRKGHSNQHCLLFMLEYLRDIR